MALKTLLVQELQPSRTHPLLGTTIPSARPPETPRTRRHVDPRTRAHPAGNSSAVASTAPPAAAAAARASRRLLRRRSVQCGPLLDDHAQESGGLLVCMNLCRNASPSLNCAFSCSAVHFADARHTRFLATAFIAKMANYFDVTSTTTTSSPTTSVQRERSAPWTTRGRVEINISSHGLLFFNGLWQRTFPSRCVIFLLVLCSAEPSNAGLLLCCALLPSAGRASPHQTFSVSCVVSLVGETRDRRTLFGLARRAHLAAE